jgi:tRNA-dihydrouridine synthase B
MKSLKIDNLIIENPVILAPQAGITDAPFRELVQSFGVGMVVSEMVASQAAVREIEKTIRRLNPLDNKKQMSPTSVQIFGADSQIMARAAYLMQEQGADMIDINMGCPVKKIVNSGGGASLMRNLPLAREIIRAVKHNIKIPLSVKMRLGWDDSSRNAIELARICEDEGVAFVTVHGRTRSQFYAGQANWEEIAEVKAALKIPLIANGDVFSVENAKNILQTTKADGVMVARGIYGRPWFCADIISYLNSGKTPQSKTSQEIYAIASKHLQSMARYYPAHTAHGLAKKHMCWYAQSMRGAAQYRAQINLSENIEDIQKIMHDFFQSA